MALAQLLQRYFLALDQGHHHRAAFGVVATLDDDGIAVVNAGLDHRIAVDLERVVFSLAEQLRRHADEPILLAQRLNRRSGRDPAHHRQCDPIDILAAGVRRFGAATCEVAANDLGVERFAVVPGWGRCVLWQANNLQCSGAMRQAPDEAAFLQPGDQAVDARFGLEIQRVLHLLEGWRHTLRPQMVVDEE